MTTTVLPPAPPLPPPGTWSRGIWVAVTLCAVVEAVVALAALFIINVGASVCRDAPTMTTVRAGEFALIVATCVGLVPWAITLAFRPRRLGLLAVAALAVSPLLYGMVAGLDPQFWTNGFCF
jgi:hypothetical protein